MYLDFEDYRPDTPRVPAPISAREGVLLSLVLHLLFVIALLVAPKSFFAPAEPVQALVPPPPEPVKFVYMAPRVDRVAPPRPNVAASDLDRRSTTRERAPVPTEAAPFSRGNTPDRVEGAPETKPAGPPTNAPAPPSPAAPPPPEKGYGETVVPIMRSAPPSGGRLGESLRDLKRYLQDQNFNNQNGGQIDSGPDIQFDSKGVEFGPWLRRFIAQVKSNWFIPQAAMIQRGRVVLQFNVHRDGRITDLTVVGPSGVEAFNLSSFNAIKLSNPTLALPAEYPLDKAFFTVTFHYNEGR
jgi:TonB family protein